MHDVVDEVKAHRHRAGNRSVLAELGQPEKRFASAIRGERVDYIEGGIGIDARVIGPHRVDNSVRIPVLEICTGASCRRGESAMLNGHMGEEIQQRPISTGRRLGEVGTSDGVDDVERVQHGDAMQWPDVGRMSKHSLMICVNLRYYNAYDGEVVAKSPDRRPDLAAMLAPLLRELVAAEEPVLAAHGVTMWGYVVLLALDRSSMRTQAALAAAIGADKTRIIRTLDDLQDDGYIERRPDPDDRRVRLLAITEAGRRVKDAVQSEIQRGEERWLGELSAEERRIFLRSLERLTPRDWG